MRDYRLYNEIIGYIVVYYFWIRARLKMAFI